MNQQSQRERRRLRLAEFDYSTPGAYFFTTVTARRQTLFGRVEGESMRLSRAGAAVSSTWNELPERLVGVGVDEFVVMPNHVHGIVWLTGESDLSLDRVLRAFKSLSAREVNGVLGREGAVWQRSYHERVVRDECELEKLRKYISENPARWAFDSENMGQA